MRGWGRVRISLLNGCWLSHVSKLFTNPTWLGFRVMELQQQLEEASCELEQLRLDRTRHAEMVEAIVRQRDMYRVLLQQGGSSPVSFLLLLYVCVSE